MNRKDNTAPPQNYAVGYGRPPAHTRFQPGHSGNPKGRLKGIKNIATIVTEILDQQITVRTASGGVRRLTRREALAHKCIESASKGKEKALMIVLNLDDRSAGSDSPLIEPQLDEENRALIDAYYIHTNYAEGEAARLATNKKKEE